jgi:hypothetical protein
MNKDFKEALEKEAHEYASLPNDDNIYHELKTGFKDGWNACYTYLQKEGGKDVASDIMDKYNSIEEKKFLFEYTYKGIRFEQNIIGEDRVKVCVKFVTYNSFDSIEKITLLLNSDNNEVKSKNNEQ